MEVTISEATTQLPQLVERAMTGEEIVIAEAGRPLVGLVHVETPPKSGNAPRKRVLGTARGLFQLAPDWDAPMTDEEREAFLSR